MTVQELLDQLKELPTDLPIRLRIQTEAGFYDVRPQFSSAMLRELHCRPGSKIVMLEGR